MSTNVHIYAVRTIFVAKTGNSDEQIINFSAWQTPTTTTLKIMEKRDKIKAYKDWVLSISKDEIVNVYADNDYFQEQEPIGTKVINEGDDHIELLDEWLDVCEENGYDVKVEAW